MQNHITIFTIHDIAGIRFWNHIALIKNINDKTPKLLLKILLFI